MKEFLGPRLKYLHFCTDQAITDAVSAMDLTAAQGHILSYLSHHPQPPCPRDIEEAFHLSHPTVSGLLQRLEKKEFIAIRPDETDRRCRRIFLLPKGEACHQKIHAVIDATEQSLIHSFTPQERAEFTRLLDKAIANMGGNPCKHCQKEEKIK